LATTKAGKGESIATTGGSGGSTGRAERRLGAIRFWVGASGEQDVVVASHCGVERDRKGSATARGTTFTGAGGMDDHLGRLNKSDQVAHSTAKERVRSKDVLILLTTSLVRTAIVARIAAPATHADLSLAGAAEFRDAGNAHLV
jgi:hypothetical protein